MDTLLKADIFFFISSIAVAVLVLILVVILFLVMFYGFRIARRIDHITKIIKKESDAISEDIAGIREKVTSGGMKFGSAIGTLFGFASSFMGAKGAKPSPKASKTKKSSRKSRILDISFGKDDDSGEGDE